MKTKNTKQNKRSIEREQAFQQLLSEYQGEVRVVPENEAYYCTDDGRVWSYKAAKFLKTAKHHANYDFIGRFTINGTYRLRLVHELVAHTYIGLRPDGMDIDHISGVKSDNSASNLRFVSRQDNMKSAWKLGLMENNRQVGKNRVGELNGKCKLKPETVLQIDAFLKSGMKQCEVAKMYKMAVGTINNIASGRCWSHITGRTLKGVKQ